MIHVVAVIMTKPGKRDEVVEAARQNLDAVRSEDGCIEYQPVIDEDFGSFQTKVGEDAFIVIENVTRNPVVPSQPNPELKQAHPYE